MWFIERDITPTLRTLFYRLVSLDVIPNTNQAYKQLSSATVKARKRGSFHGMLFLMKVLADFVEEYQTPEQYVESHIDLIKEAYANNILYGMCK